MDTADDTFKLPSLDVRHKFTARKSATEKPPTLVDESVENRYEDTAAVAPRKTPAEPPTIDQTNPTPNRKPFAAPSNSPYIEPAWSAPPPIDADIAYSIEMLKSGTIVETVDDLQHQAFWLIGKLADNHIVMAHPTVSRYHAVLQYRPDVRHESDDAADAESKNANDDVDQKQLAAAAQKRIEAGWYLYDLGSTHGSFVNKRRVPAKTYVRVRVGYMLSFGASTRRLILQGPDADAEPASELSITELKQQRADRRAEAEAKEAADKIRAEEEEKKREAEGATWGMQEDADEETDLSVNPYAVTSNEELFLQDPKKTLRGYFEREGADLEYKVDELAVGSFVCRIELPISDSNGRPIVCEVSHKGKKKDCVAQSALEACRILDRHGVLRQSHHESRKRKVQHSDSDGDDDFYDRTGDIERKRVAKEAAAAEAAQSARAYNHAELVEQERELVANLAAVNGRIESYALLEMRARAEARQIAPESVDLDDFMERLTAKKEVKTDRTEIRRLRVEAKTLDADLRRLQRLICIARPVDMPALVGFGSVAASATTTTPAVEPKKKFVLPLFGKRGAPLKLCTTKTAVAAVVSENVHSVEDDVEELPDTGNNGEDVVLTENPNTEQCEPDEKSIAENNEPIPTISAKDAAVQPESSENSEKAKVLVDDDDNVATSKKKRSRPHIRRECGRGRDNIDIAEPDGIVADTAKYSTWVPPENQSGDGSTALNDKFGY